ncbi:autotransporter domain-containing protein [Sediminicoccus rosea]|uniref:Autotransporter domain-containing protein n=1 Tax=Sediminicoccus rosea TaxID=1225128 RepID=A0ABZ0PE84_9PROT|nr:autotransporter domain-containing protein [Sediminicoccus rosea]WPB83927.1 autotransporter domain-containing protein [Sediminicoccus rosea]
MKRLPAALLATTALVAVMSLAQPAWSTGGAGGNGGAGGTNSATATGGAGGNRTGTAGGGGGGAGATGGAGGSAGAGAGGAGGATAGAAGAAGQDGAGVGASGGGGGAHGAVGMLLPSAPTTGGQGGQGGQGSAGGSGGGGGAGGWGAAVTSNPGTATLNATLTGGDGGNGGSGGGGGLNGGGGAGGTGLHLGSAVTRVTINAAVTGGNGGNATSPAAAGAGGAGIAIGTIFTTNLVIGAAVSGGLAGNGGAQGFALSTGTTGAHRLTIAPGGSLNGGISIGTGSSLTLAQATDVTISNVISGGGSLEIDGTGMVTLSGANTYSGGTILLSGAVSVAADAALGQVNSGVGLRVTGNSRLITTASFSSSRVITLSALNGGVFAPALGTVLTLTGSITQSGTPIAGFTVAGQGTLIYTGTGAPRMTAINTGATLQIGAGGTTGSLGTGPITNDGTLILNRSNTLTMNNAISGTGGLIHNGTGTTTLGGTLSYTGPTRVQAGTLVLTTAGLFSGGTARFEVASGATLNLTGLSGVLAAATLDGGGAVQLPGSGRLSLNGDSSFSGVISGGAALRLAGGATILSGSNTFSGGTTIEAGATLQLGQGGTTGSVPGAVENNGTLAFHRSDAVSMAEAISGTGSLVQMGPGTLTLTGANTYAGTTTIAGGTLRVGDGAASGTLGAGAIVNNGTLGFARPDAISLPNNMTGTGALSLASGTVTATGSLGHGGGTTIGSGARLNIGNGGTTGSLAGNVVNNGTLSFARSDNVTFAGAISGPGGLQQNGTGNLILTGANTYTGPTVVNSGTLSVNGSISSASVITVAAGATLGGSGQMGAVTVPAGGTMAPGNSIGTINLAGLTLDSGSTTAIEIEGSAIDRINVTGNASLGGTLRLLPLGGSYRFDTTYVIIQAGSITGSFATVTTAGSFGAGVTPTVSVTATQVQLALTPAILLATPELTPGPTATDPAAPTVARAPGIPGFLTHNLRATAAALDAANRAGGNLNPLFPVYSQPAATIGFAVNQLSGEVATSIGAMGFAAGEQFLAALLDPLGHGRASQLGGRLSAGSDGSDALPSDGKRYAVWGSAMGAYNRTTGDAQDGSASRTTRMTGFVLGMDHLIGAQGMLGLAIAVGESSAALASGQGSASANLGQIGAYGSTRLGSFTLAGAGAVTLMDVDSSRTQYALGSDQQRAGFSARVTSLRAEARQDGLVAGGFRLQPLVAIQWQQVNNQGYTESGLVAGTATGLTVAGQSQTSLRTELGGQLRGSVQLGTLPVQSFLRAAWASYLVRDAAMTVTFASLPDAGFVVRGARADANAALVSAGVEMPLTRGWTLGARVDGEFSGNVTQLAGTARLRYTF